MLYIRLKIIIFFLVFIPHSGKSIFPWDTVAEILLKRIYGNSVPLAPNYTDPQWMTTGELVQNYGYPFENHRVTTDDGYILELHRIPHGKSLHQSYRKTPIVIIPGLLADSGCFVTIGELNCAGFVFSNAGYDVWLHNNRGTRYSRKHTHLSPDTQREYWNYSFHEMGVYDLPASVDYILSTTNATQVYLIGHSMGGSSISIFIAERLSYNSKVKAAFLLAPAIGLKHTQISLAHMPKLSETILLLFDEMEILPYNNNTLMLIENICNDPNYKILCLFSIQQIFQTNFSTSYISRALSGTCAKVLRHFLQLASRDYFYKYDYGSKGNMEIYGYERTPPYPLENASAPVFVFYADNDRLIKTDIVNISQHFGNIMEFIHVPDETFDHYDFILSPKAKMLVYDVILARMSMLSDAEPLSPYMFRLSNQFIYVALIFLFVALFIFYQFILEMSLNYK